MSLSAYPVAEKSIWTSFPCGCGGCVCASCQGKTGGNPIDGSTLYAMQYIISTSVEKIIHLPSDTGGGGRVSEFTAILPESLCGT